MKKWFNMWDANEWPKVGETFRVGPWVGKCIEVMCRPDMYSRLCCMEMEVNE